MIARSKQQLISTWIPYLLTTSYPKDTQWLLSSQTHFTHIQINWVQDRPFHVCCHP